MPGLIQQSVYKSKKAVLVGISYATNDNLQDNEMPELPGTHEDVKNLRKVLMSALDRLPPSFAVANRVIYRHADKYGWSSDDITLLMDDTDVPDERWPSRANIVSSP